MTATDKFIALTRKGEDTRIEYKSCTEEISESLYESVCSFLNHRGGQILVGVQNDGTIIGVNPDKVEQLRTDIVNCINNPELFLPCPYFTPRIMEVEGKSVMQLDIPCGQYVYRFKGRYWDRNDDADIDVTDQPELLLSIFERKNPFRRTHRGWADDGTFGSKDFPVLPQHSSNDSALALMATDDE